MATEATLAELKQRLAPAGRISNLGLPWLEHLSRIECGDGFSMSVQASHTHYCAPRNSEGPWTQVEVGYPTEKVEAFMPYIDGSGAEATRTVYGYVPIELVADAIDAHGGFKPSP